MLAAATLPAAIARMAVAGPVTQSPPGEEVVLVADLTAQGRDERAAALDGHARLLKALHLDALADGHDDDVRRNALLGADPPCSGGDGRPCRPRR